jgi:6-pyruvoyltetrahydropterin/6-carboxytetrahydropterin synthase
MVMDLGELKRVVGDAVISRFDHADLNADPAFASAIPTTENLVCAIWELLAPNLGVDRLYRLRLWEDPSFHVEYFGT